MSQKAGVRILDRFYPFVDQFRHGDPILIHEVTGLGWDEFSDMLSKASDESGRGVNPIVQTALIAVAIQREHQTWSRREVSEFIRNLDLGDEQYVAGDPIEEGDALPPAESGVSSSSSDKTSPPSPESPSSPNPTDSGPPGSGRHSQESLQTA